MPVMASFAIFIYFFNLTYRKKPIDRYSKSIKDIFRFELLFTSLEIEFEVNPFLVRGLDYYNHTAFEYIFSEKSS